MRNPTVKPARLGLGTTRAFACLSKMLIKLARPHSILRVNYRDRAGFLHSELSGGIDLVLEGQPGSRLVYQPGVVVQAVRDNADVALVQTYDMHTHAPLAFKAKRVFVAGGPIPTTSILLRSLGREQRIVRIDLQVGCTVTQVFVDDFFP